jgi:hypothetical protein
VIRNGSACLGAGHCTLPGDFSCPNPRKSLLDRRMTGRANRYE